MAETIENDDLSLYHDDKANPKEKAADGEKAPVEIRDQPEQLVPDTKTDEQVRGQETGGPLDDFQVIPSNLAFSTQSDSEWEDDDDDDGRPYLYTAADDIIFYYDSDDEDCVGIEYVEMTSSVWLYEDNSSSEE